MLAFWAIKYAINLFWLWWLWVIVVVWVGLLEQDVMIWLEHGWEVVGLCDEVVDGDWMDHMD